MRLSCSRTIALEDIYVETPYTRSTATGQKMDKCPRVQSRYIWAHFHELRFISVKAITSIKIDREFLAPDFLAPGAPKPDLASISGFTESQMQPYRPPYRYASNSASSGSVDPIVFVSR